MAEFGPQATELSAPQGQGANVVKPVTAGIDLSGVSQLISGYGKIQEMEADRLQKSILKQYTDNRAKYAQAAEGGKELSMINARRQADSAKYRQMYPGLLKDFDNIDESFTKNTAAGDAADEAKTARDLRKKMKEQAVANGFVIGPQTSEASEEAMIQASQQSIAMMRDFELKQKQVTYQQSLLNFNEGEKKAQMQDYVRKVLPTTADSFVTAFQSTVNDALKAVQTNPDSYREIMLQLRGTASKLSTQLAPFKEVAGAEVDVYTKALDDLVSNAERMLDPADASTDKATRLQNMFKEMQARSALQLVADDPRLKTLAGSNLIFDPTAASTWGSQKLYTQSILPLLEVPGVAQIGDYPTVVGSKDQQVQQKTYDEVLKVTRTVDTLKNPDALAQTKNVIENLLDQTAILNSRTNVRPEDLAPFVKLLSDPSMGNAIKKLNVSPEKLEQAGKLMERYFSSQLIPQIDSMLTGVVNTTIMIPRETIKLSRDSGYKTKDVQKANIQDTVVFNMSSEGIRMVPKAGSNVDAGELSDAVGAAERAINTTLKMEANLTGKSVEEVWNSKRHIIFPGKFPEGFNMKPGDTLQVNGETMRYKGGFVTSKSSWDIIPGGAKP